MTTQYDPETGLHTLVKQPGESRLYDIDMADVMRAADTIASFVSGYPKATNMNNIAGSDDVTVGSGSHNNATIAQVRIQGGQDQENYKITFRVNTTLGDIIEADGMLYVRDL